MDNCSQCILNKFILSQVTSFSSEMTQLGNIYYSYAQNFGALYPHTCQANILNSLNIPGISNVTNSNIYDSLLRQLLLNNFPNINTGFPFLNLNLPNQMSTGMSTSCLEAQITANLINNMTFNQNPHENVNNLLLTLVLQGMQQHEVQNTQVGVNNNNFINNFINNFNNNLTNNFIQNEDKNREKTEGAILKSDNHGLISGSSKSLGKSVRQRKFINYLVFYFILFLFL